MTTREHDMRPTILAGWKAGAFTRLGKDLLLTLNGYAEKCGSIWPSHATLADRLQCHERSVCRTLAELRAAGWVVWERRYRRSGWRVVRSSNLYALRAPGEMRRRRATRLSGGGIKTSINKGIEEGAPRSVRDQLRAFGMTPEQARAELATIAASMAARLAVEWAERRSTKMLAGTRSPI